MGVTLALVGATGFLLLASVIAGLVRVSLSPFTFCILAWPGLLVGGITLCLYLVGMFWGLIGYIW